MSFHPEINETQDPLFEGQHSDQKGDSDTVMQKGQFTEITKV